MIINSQHLKPLSSKDKNFLTLDNSLNLQLTKIANKALQKNSDLIYNTDISSIINQNAINNTDSLFGLGKPKTVENPDDNYNLISYLLDNLIDIEDKIKKLYGNQFEIINWEKDNNPDEEVKKIIGTIYYISDCFNKSSLKQGYQYNVFSYTTKTSRFIVQTVANVKEKKITNYFLPVIKKVDDHLYEIIIVMIFNDYKKLIHIELDTVSYKIRTYQ